MRALLRRIFRWDARGDSGELRGEDVRANEAQRAGSRVFSTGSNENYGNRFTH